MTLSFNFDEAIKDLSKDRKRVQYVINRVKVIGIDKYFFISYSLELHTPILACVF